MKKIISTGAGLIIILLISSCSPNAPVEEGVQQVEDLRMQKKKTENNIITIEEQDLFPEGIEYDVRNDRFLVTSVTRGTVGEVKNGEYREIINDDDLISSIGIHIDHSGKRILVANANLQGSLAALAAYDLEGNRIFYTNLGELAPGNHFANDVTVDNRGNAYVTDSFAGVIYRVDPSGNAGIFYQNDVFIPAPGGFGLNGIDYDPQGFLLVSNVHEIIRFPIQDPSAYNIVQLPFDLNFPDGLYLKNPNELLVVNNDLGGPDANVQTFRTKDKWESAQLVDEFKTSSVFPTTVTVKRNSPYVLYAHLDVLLSGGPRSTYSIVKAD